MDDLNVRLQALAAARQDRGDGTRIDVIRLAGLYEAFIRAGLKAAETYNTKHEATHNEYKRPKKPSIATE